MDGVVVAMEAVAVVAVVAVRVVVDVDLGEEESGEHGQPPQYLRGHLRAHIMVVLLSQAHTVLSQRGRCLENTTQTT